MQEFPEIMGMMDAAEFLDVSRQYIDRLARTGKLRYRQTSAGLIFLKSDLKLLMAQRPKRVKKAAKKR